MSKYTPGPWRIEDQDIIGNEINGYVCTWSGRAADADLISAAPDLLEALKLVMQDGCGAYQWIDDKAYAAIAKAEGR